MVQERSEKLRVLLTGNIDRCQEDARVASHAFFFFFFFRSARWPRKNNDIAMSRQLNLCLILGELLG